MILRTKLKFPKSLVLILVLFSTKILSSVTTNEHDSVFQQNLPVNPELSNVYQQQQLHLQETKSPVFVDLKSRSNNPIAAKDRELSADQLTSFNVSMQAQLPIPRWLFAFTGIKEWPGIDPPYIPLDFIDFNKIPNIPTYTPGRDCPRDRSSCSFDCFKCVSYDDVYSCPILSQTFDDGPSKDTPKLLDHLKSRTTFFTLGINIVRFPDIYREAMKRGHLMASHTWSHKPLPSLTNEQIIAQFEWSIWAMNATGHHIPKWYRPPYGAVDDRVRAISRMFGLQAVLWDYDSFDWKLETKPPGNTKEKIFDDVKFWKSRNMGGLILEHDAFFSTVDTGKGINDIIGPNQMTVSQCVNSFDYIKVFKDTEVLSI